MAETETIDPSATKTEEVQNIYDEIEIDDMDFEDGKFFYPCPCGDKFQINIVSEKGILMCIISLSYTLFLKLILLIETNYRRLGHRYLPQLLIANQGYLR